MHTTPETLYITAPNVFSMEGLTLVNAIYATLIKRKHDLKFFFWRLFINIKTVTITYSIHIS